MIRDRRPALLAALLGAAVNLLSANASAMSFVPMSDEALFDKADVVVRGRIVAAHGSAGRELDETSYQLQVDSVLKGTVAAGDLDLRLPGAYDQSQVGALIVPGVPRFAQDEPVLLFLDRRPDRNYSPSQLLLGVFRERNDVDDESVLVQDLDTAELFEASGEPQRVGRHRNTQRFMDWLRDRMAGNSHDKDYWTERALAPGRKYQLTTPQVRWFQFQSATVPIYANSSGLGNDDLQAAIQAWNDAPGSTVALVYSGLSSKSGGLDIADGVNEVLFDDPNDELLGSFDCLLGGLGAYGKWRSLGTRQFNGETYGVITEGDIVVQDGISCLFSGRRNENAAELLAHELGHVLGLAHSCGDGLLAVCTPGSAADKALMRPTLHADGRGASLSADDIAGLAKLYGPDTSSGGGGGSEDPDTAGGSESSGGGALDTVSLLLILLAGCAGWALRIGFPRSEAVDRRRRKTR